MERFFNTAGSMIPEDHYCIDPLARIDWDDIQRLIYGKRYFVMHAPRQTGKISTLLAMMHELNGEGHYACAYTNIVAVQAARGDVAQGIATLCSVASRNIERYLQRPEQRQWYINENKHYPLQDQLSTLLEYLTLASDKPTPNKLEKYFANAVV